MALRVNIYFLVAGLTFLLPVSVFGQTPLVDGPEWTDIGQDAVLTCTSTANIRIVEWARSDFGNSLGESDLVVNLRTSTGTVININNTRYGFDKDATEYPLTIKSVTFDDGGTYWCILAVDDFQYIYAMKELRVRVLPKSVKMSDLTGSYPTTGGTAYLVEGLNHQFICEAPDINPGASFKWSLAGREIVEDSSSDFTGADNFITSNSTLTLSPVWNNHGEMLQCRASNKEGHVGLFTMVTLDVKVIPKASSLSLSDSDGAVHDEVVVDEDTPHLFTCQVLGTRPGARIEWYLNGVQRRVLNQGPAGAVGLVTTSDTLSLIPTRADHGQMVTCEASIAESPRPYPSLNVTLIVNGPPDVPGISGSTALTENEPTILTCSSDMGYPDDWDLVWSNGGLPITGPTTRPSASDGRYNFTSTFNYTPRRQDNGNIIKCTANRTSLTPGQEGSYGPVDLQFCARIVSVTQSPPVLTAGGKATLSCTPESSNPATTLTWSKEDVELTTPTSQPNSGGAYGGRVTRVSYTTGVLNKTNNGEVYKCCATNPAISTCATNLCDRHILSVQYSPEFTSLKQIPDAFATEGSDVTLTCVVDAKPRPVGINWKKQGSNKTFNSAYIDDTSTLTLNNIRREQAGNYTCRANNGVPTDDPSSDAISSPLTIIVHYEASITNKFNNIVGAKHGGVTVITCITRANPKPIISWYNPNDTIISPDYGSGKFLIETDTTSGDRIYGFTVTSTLTIRGVDSLVDYGVYTVNSSNGIGDGDTLQINLTAPRIPSKPIDVQVTQRTADSLTLRWTAGNDGGEEQSFRISYLKISESGGQKVFTDAIRAIDGQKVYIYTVISLQPSTEYLIRVYAENGVGRNMESINTTAYTLMKITEKPPESEESSKHVDLITGVVAGVVVLIVIIVFAVRLSRRARSYPAVSEQAKKTSRKMRRRLKSNTQEDKRANYKNILEMNAVSTAGQEQAAPSYANVCNSQIAFPRDQLTIVKEIGHGSFGLVFLAEANGIIERSKVTQVAVKTIKEEANTLQRRDMLRELELMKKLPDHPNVVKLLGFCVDQDPLYIIVEYLSRGNLKNLLKQSRGKGGRVYRNLHGISKSLASTDLIMFAKDTADGMEFISSQKCIHRDLAARNVLVAEDMTCKVSDFGLARDVMNIRVYERESESALPMRWMAIESILDDVYTTESDVWSFGVLLWEIATLGARPYPAMSAKVLISELQNGFRMPKPQHCQDELYEMMLRCWNEDPASRPSFKMISDDLDRLICEGKDYLSIEDIEDAVYEVSLPGGTLERL